MIPLAGYRYLRQLGDPGHFGTVFLACNLLSGREVAIKHIDEQLTPDAVAAWIAEAEAMAACRHQNLVEILHAEVTAHGPALVMEFVPGGSVAAQWGDAPAPVGDVVRTAIDACWGLQRLHVEGLTHRDIKPANLLIGDRGVKVGDFGLAGSSARPVDAIYVAHKPPEIGPGQPWTEVADIYSLGVTAWRLLWGDDLAGRHDPDVLARAAAGQWPDRGCWPVHVHKRLRTVLRAAMDPDPTRRPASASALRSKLEEATPLVSWRPVSDGRWEGATGCARWEVDRTTRNGSIKVETRRDLGSGARRVAVGCGDFSGAADADRYIRRLIDSIAVTGSV